MQSNYLMLGVHALGAFKCPFSALSINMSCLLWGMNELIIILKYNAEREPHIQTNDNDDI